MPESQLRLYQVLSRLVKQRPKAVSENMRVDVFGDFSPGSVIL